MHIWIGFVAALVSLSSVASPSQANDHRAPLVVELFTSQGCAACPPADAMLAALAMRDDVIALGLHVDYWDYIGWEDSFADSAFSDRQKHYARRWQRSSVFTPQMIVNGTEEVRKFRRDTLKDVLERHHAQPRQVSLQIERGADNRVTVRLSAEPPLSERADILLVRYKRSAEVEITSGENNGRSLTYHNIVTAIEAITRWDGQSTLDLTLETPGDDPAVVLVQEENQGAMLAAGRAP